MLSRREWVFTKWSLQGKAGQAEGEREARRLTGKWSGGGGWLMGEEGECDKGENVLGHPTETACVCVEAKDGRNEKLCGIRWLQGSERLWLKVLFTWHEKGH